MARRRVAVVHSGGTIGMAPTADGWQPRAGHLATLLEAMPELDGEGMPERELIEHEPLLDSAEMKPSDWRRIAGEIRDRHDDFDGFVVLHGTDTMAYTAAALSFLLDGLARPVLLTGSQIPLCRIRNDARRNLITALQIAAGEEIPEVCLYFNGRLLRGNRAVKVNSEQFEAFDSPNFPPLGRAGVEIEIRRELVRARRPGPLRLDLEREAVVGALRLFPGIDAKVVENALRPPLEGLVLECFGKGNGPASNAGFLGALSRATARGVVIVAVTQCLRGRVELGDYATGRALREAGVIAGADLTAEAALTKLWWLLARGLGVEDVRREMGRDLRGELTLHA